MKSILITGCNRGIGLGLVKHLVKQANPPKYLIATCRDSSDSEELHRIANDNSCLHVLNIDLCNTDTFPQFAERVESIVKDDGLNVLVNNAGVSTKFTRLDLVKVEQLLESFQTNTIGPIMLTKALHSVLKRASELNAQGPLGSSRAAVINMSSILGSIGRNDTGGFYPYRSSKAALNAATKSMSIDLKDDGIMAVAIHPGWVKTDMGGSKAVLDVETCALSIVSILKNLQAGHNGMFLQYDGKELAW